MLESRYSPCMACYLVLQEQRHDVLQKLHDVVQSPGRLDDGHQVQPALHNLGQDVAQLGQQQAAVAGQGLTAHSAGNNLF